VNNLDVGRKYSAGPGDGESDEADHVGHHWPRIVQHVTDADQPQRRSGHEFVERPEVAVAPILLHNVVLNVRKIGRRGERHHERDGGVGESFDERHLVGERETAIGHEGRQPRDAHGERVDGEAARDPRDLQPMRNQVAALCEHLHVDDGHVEAAPFQLAQVVVVVDGHVATHFAQAAANRAVVSRWFYGFQPPPFPKSNQS